MKESEHVIVTTRPEAKNIPMVLPPGMTQINIPLTRIVPLEVDSGDIENFSPDLFIFTSSTGVQYFLSMAISAKYRRSECIAIGEATASALAEFSNNIMVPDRRDSSGVNEVISRNSFRNRRIALISSRQSNNVIRDFLSANSFNFRSYQIYDAVPLYDQRLKEFASDPNVLGIMITSSQEARIMAEILHPSEVTAPLYAVGNVTYHTMKKLGFSVEDEVGNSHIQELAERIIRKHSGEWI